MTLVVRRLLPAVFALVTLALGASVAGPSATAAATARTFPIETLGDRGADVRAIQGLLTHHGFPVPIDGVFGASTRAAVRAFQAARGLPVDGLVRETTWVKLVPALASGSTGEAVKVLQRQLNEKRFAHLAVTGFYGTATRAAVITFQKHMGLTANGLVGPVTWRTLLWHFDYPAFNATSLCDYGVGNGTANWGTGAAIGHLEAAAAMFATTGRGRVPVGDISREHGGDIALHQTHEVGLDVDVRPVRDARNQCTWGTNWRAASYDRAATRALIKIIRAEAGGHIKLIYFNDPVLIREGLTRWFSGHDDHIHVRYCEPYHPSVTYRCG